MIAQGWCVSHKGGARPWMDAQNYNKFVDSCVLKMALVRIALELCLQHNVTESSRQKNMHSTAIERSTYVLTVQHNVLCLQHNVTERAPESFEFCASCGLTCTPFFVLFPF